MSVHNGADVSSSEGLSTGLRNVSLSDAGTVPPVDTTPGRNNLSPEEAGLSKNEIKRRRKADEKARKVAEKKAAKEAEAAARGTLDAGNGRKKESARNSEEVLDPSQYVANRKAFVESQRAAGTNPYPHKFKVSMRIPEFINKYSGGMEAGQRDDSVTLSLAGRIHSIRESGAKLVFYDLRGDGAAVQVIADAQLGGESFAEDHANARRGDIIGVTGHPGKSRRGEFSLFVVSVKVLSSCLHMLPKKGLTDPEVRFRQRYLDLIVNGSVRETFITRSKIIRYLRNFLDERDFLEVETPTMNTVAGGATACPFVTHHKEMKIDMYMRVAPELSLKMLVIGGLDRVYEIGRNYRNEGLDLTHNTEFTSCEFYEAYADYNDLMDMTELLISGMVKNLTGGYKVTLHPSGKTKENGSESEAVEIDFTPPFRRMSMVTELEKRLREVLDDPTLSFPANMGAEGSQQYLESLFARLPDVECKEPRTVARLLDALVGDFLESDCVNPTFICDHPQVMSPLAKDHRDLPHMTERFELFVNRRELCNAYTELNDPVIQRERFRATQKDSAAGDDEAMVHDENFVVALEHGLPPTGGWGLGIDRLTMLLTDHISIREVLLYPAMKPI